MKKMKRGGNEGLDRPVELVGRVEFGTPVGGSGVFAQPGAGRRGLLLQLLGAGRPGGCEEERK